jgi:hypothetical protein
MTVNSGLIIRDPQHGLCEQCERVLDGTPSYWGVCPVCHQTDGCINIGKAHWYFCKEHKTRWCVGANLFSTWRTQTEEEQRAIYDGLDFGTFTDVKPHRCE